MTRSRNPADPPLAADDPRISEWLDGRLPPAAAAAVERAVRGSPKLARLVDDLRAVRGALSGMSVAEPPAGFSDRVMAAVEAGPRPAAGRGSPARGSGAGTRIWRAWPALAAALAAGVLVAIMLNRPGPGDREVALGPALPEVVEDAWTPPAAAPAAVTRGDREMVDGGAAPGADQVAAVAVEAANAVVVSEEAERLRSLGGVQATKAAAAAAPPPDAARARTEFDETAAFAAAEGRPGARPRQGMAGLLVIEVATATSRQALDRLVAASGLEATRAGDRLELVGSAATMNAFLRELERAGVVPASPRREAKGSGGGDQPERLVIMVLEPKRQATPGEVPP